ncbi:hypothetical protein UMZ34_04360 [Halopseudomonas pachastrellae]|nr:hypothetical protein UMZ34_04360 [Halopseudomonas pachastrellae]
MQGDRHGAEKTPQSAPTKQSELAASKVAVGEAYEKLLEARDHFASAAQAAGLEVRHDALEHLLKGREKAEELGAQANTYIRENRWRPSAWPLPLALYCRNCFRAND